MGTRAGVAVGRPRGQLGPQIKRSSCLIAGQQGQLVSRPCGVGRAASRAPQDRNWAHATAPQPKPAPQEVLPPRGPDPRTPDRICCPLGRASLPPLRRPSRSAGVPGPAHLVDHQPAGLAMLVDAGGSPQAGRARTDNQDVDLQGGRGSGGGVADRDRGQRWPRALARNGTPALLRTVSILSTAQALSLLLGWGEEWRERARHSGCRRRWSYNRLPLAIVASARCRSRGSGFCIVASGFCGGRGSRPRRGARGIAHRRAFSPALSAFRWARSPTTKGRP